MIGGNLWVNTMEKYGFLVFKKNLILIFLAVALHVGQSLQPLQWKHGALTIGLPGKPMVSYS